MIVRSSHPQFFNTPSAVYNLPRQAMSCVGKRVKGLLPKFPTYSRLIQARPQGPRLFFHEISLSSLAAETRKLTRNEFSEFQKLNIRVHQLFFLNRQSFAQEALIFSTIF